MSDIQWQNVKCWRGMEEIAHLWYPLKDMAYFLGGYVRYMASPVKPTKEDVPGDIDLYPKASQLTEILGTSSFRLSMTGMDDQPTTIAAALEQLGYELTFESPAALSYTRQGSDLKVQVIKPFAEQVTGDIIEILENFDFTIARAGLVDIDQAIVDSRFINDEMQRKLRIETIHCPISGVKRIAKYVKKGYNISPTEIIKLFEDWDNRPREYQADLKEAISILSDPAKKNLKQFDPDRYEELWSLLYID